MQSDNQDQEIARCMQFILGEICCKINNTKVEIKQWLETELKEEEWIDAHIRYKKAYLGELLKQQIYYMEVLNTYMRTGEILHTYEIFRRSEKLRDENFENKLDQMVERCINE